MNLVQRILFFLVQLFNKLTTPKALNKNDFTEIFNEHFSDYHYNILAELHKRYNLKGKKILDVGGSNIPVEIMKAYDVKQFICLDSVSKWSAFHSETSTQKYYFGKKVFLQKDITPSTLESEFSFIIDSEIEEFNTLDYANYFDIIISVSTFEHVTNINMTMNKIYELLKPHGVFFTSYEPIYSSHAGHHMYINANINFHNTPELDFIHLLSTKEKARDYLISSAVFEPYSEKMLDQIFESSIINRKMYNEHIIEIMNSKFNSYSVNYFCIAPLDDEIYLLLTEKYGSMRYDIRGIQLTAWK